MLLCVERQGKGWTIEGICIEQLGPARWSKGGGGKAREACERVR